MHTYIHTHTHVYVHLHIYTYIHTHTHTGIRLDDRKTAYCFFINSKTKKLTKIH